jgi:hypothetical protein
MLHYVKHTNLCWTSGKTLLIVFLIVKSPLDIIDFGIFPFITSINWSSNHTYVSSTSLATISVANTTIWFWWYITREKQQVGTSTCSSYMLHQKVNNNQILNNPIDSYHHSLVNVRTLKHILNHYFYFAYPYQLHCTCLV